MSQVSSIAVGSGSGLSVRQGFNDVIAAIASMHSGASAPPAPFPFMLWADEANNRLFIRNAANTAWEELRSSAAMGLGSAALKNTGTSGGVIPLLNTENVWSSPQRMSTVDGEGMGFEVHRASATGANGTTVSSPRFGCRLGNDFLFSHRLQHVVGSHIQGQFILNDATGTDTWTFNRGGTAYGGSWQNASDIRIKPDFTPIPDPIAALRELRGGTWTSAITGQFGVGLVAQDAERAVPGSTSIGMREATLQTGETITDVLAIDTGSLGVAVLVEAAKAMLARIETLEAQVVHLSA